VAGRGSGRREFRSTESLLPVPSLDFRWGRLRGGHYHLGITLLYQDRVDEALAEIELESVEPMKQHGRAMALYRANRRAEADAALLSFIESFGEALPDSLAEVYAWRGQADEAFEPRLSRQMSNVEDRTCARNLYYEPHKDRSVFPGLLVDRLLTG
jgi:hypothetical protein